jgi:malate dehydrogenase (oxaloacetate-decarboxylating)(NADP+)
MTVPSTPYWTNGVQKLKAAVSQRMFFLLKVLANFLIFRAFLGAQKAAIPQPPSYLKHGLFPPALDVDIHVQRCLMQLRSKDKNLEKYIYLSHLKAGDASTFYKLCLEHMSEITPIIYTPTVGDACLHFSHIYRRPEGLVCVF